MKKLLSLVIVLLSGIAAFAASPDLQDITLTDYNSGETLDFYADQCNKVVYYCPESPHSRIGQYYLGRTLRSQDGYTEAKIEIELPMSYGPQTLSGTILYKTGSGYVLYVKLEYGTFKASERLVLPRWLQR